MRVRHSHRLAATLVAMTLCSASRAAEPAVPEALPGAPPLPATLRARLALALKSRPADWTPRTRHLRSDGSPRYTNRLALESR